MDPHDLEDTLVNLLENAIKYTPTGGLVRLTSVAQAGFCRIRVEDTGPGIAAEELPLIFDWFYRVDKARGRSGTGLGLSLARQRTERNGGKLSVTSQPGAGSCFLLELPLSSQRPAEVSQ